MLGPAGEPPWCLEVDQKGGLGILGNKEKSSVVEISIWPGDWGDGKDGLEK